MPPSAFVTLSTNQAIAMDHHMDETTSYIVKDPEAFAHNLARVLEQSGKALAAYLEARERGEAQDVCTPELKPLFKSLAQISEYWLSDPQRTIEAQTRLWSAYMDVWSRSIKRMLGEEETAGNQDVADRRFQHPDWHKLQFFDFLRQVYLITSNWAESLVLEANVDEHTRKKAEFCVKQIANALSPSNFILTNPELLKETLESNGENLVRGMKLLAEDIKLGQGELRVRQTDPTSFKVGENLALTPGKVISQNDICQVIQYEPTTGTVFKRPLVIVPPWINKYYILDLNSEKSFVKWAVAQGHTVFVISWVNPDERQALKSFEHYMKEGILKTLDVVKRATGQNEVNAIGYCVGGTLLAVTLAYLTATDDKRIASATFFATQVDFTHAGDLKVFVDEE